MQHYHIGTSGWTYDDWQGLVYPPGISGAKRLAFYATLFDSVEVNATFYRFASSTMIAAWNRQLPPNFHLCIKGSRRITHVKQLAKPELVQLFLERVGQMQHARVVLWQMPPHRTFDPGYLQDFIQLIKAHSPKNLRHAIECRDASWWTDKTYALMAAANIAFVCISHPTLPGHWVQTADFVYVRLHGLDAHYKYRYDYSRRELSVWAKHLQSPKAKHARYVFFNNDYNAYAVRNAQALYAQLQTIAPKARSPR
jgi:uncharacterized protein YecE (DUF72 family)